MCVHVCDSLCLNSTQQRLLSKVVVNTLSIHIDHRITLLNIDDKQMLSYPTKVDSFVYVFLCARVLQHLPKTYLYIVFSDVSNIEENVLIK